MNERRAHRAQPRRHARKPERPPSPESPEPRRRTPRNGNRIDAREIRVHLPHSLAQRIETDARTRGETVNEWFVHGAEALLAPEGNC